MTANELYPYFLEHPEVSTDTRKIVKNGIFFALKGPNFNGNAFANQALENGAAYAVIDDPEYLSGSRTLLVDDVLTALQDLARLHRNRSQARVIGLTGSNGKTTTKELIAAVLRKKYNTLATSGNLNNHIGVPLTLLRIRPETEMAVIEMGANHIGEIKFLCAIAEPEFGYITNFGKAHLEGFGSEEGVIRGKSELYDFLKGANRYIFMNGDDVVQRDLLNGYVKKIGFSSDRIEFYQIQFLGADPYVRFKLEDMEIGTHLVGRYNFPNCAAAALIGKYFNVQLPEIREAISSYRPENNRSQIIRRNGLEIILDAYNANPTSMLAALENLTQMSTSRKIAILGDMFELGKDAAQEHENISREALSKDFEAVYFVGSNFHKTKGTDLCFEEFESLSAYLKEHPISVPATVLIKGSRGMALERILDFL